MERVDVKGIDDALKNGVEPIVHSGENALAKVDEIYGNAGGHAELFNVKRPEYPKPIDVAAYHGIAGQIVEAIAPETEADPTALLLQFLVAAGNIFGRSPYFQIGGSRHRCNLFLVCVGDTSNGRKGTAWDCIEYLLKPVAEAWTKQCTHSGSSSGEGWIWAIRDEIRKFKLVKKGKDQVSEEVVEDPGVSDKRALLIESEFSTLLKVMTREGNTLSDIVRKAWDGKTLASLTKNSPAKATDPHISLIGHITKTELVKYMTETEAANGFANRMLWSCVRRSKLLPDGGDLQSVGLSRFTKELNSIIEFSASAQAMSRDSAAAEMWREVYKDLTRDQSGLLGAMSARLAPMTLRFAMIYALLDRSTIIQAKHLEAALAVIEYGENSCRYIFGDSLGDPIADELLRALRQSPIGLTKTQIRDLFSRNKKAHQVDGALNRLLQDGLVRLITEPTTGRPVERWIAIRR